jgi:hypothetical protein
MIKLPHVRLGGVETGTDLGVGSLMLSPNGFLLMTFFAFLATGGVAVTFAFAIPSPSGPSDGIF